MIPSDLSIGGFMVILFGVLILICSGWASDKKREIYKNYPFNGFERIVKPFRIQDKGKLTCTISDLVFASGVRIFLTDLFPSIDIDYTWGPRYFQTSKQGNQILSKNLGRGEYALVIDGEGAHYDGKFSLEFKSREYPNEKYSAWGLALIEIGASMMLLGLALA
jgi:hypothetical protein